MRAVLFNFLIITDQQAPVLAHVGIMTGKAWFIGAVVHRYRGQFLCRMAGLAELLRRSAQHPALCALVGVVTGKALSLGGGIMQPEIVFDRPLSDFVRVACCADLFLRLAEFARHAATNAKHLGDGIFFRLSDRLETKRYRAFMADRTVSFDPERM